MRYAKHHGGRKYRETEDAERVEREPQRWSDEEKREVALVYKERLDRVREDETYRQMREEHEEGYRG
jgi:hypothetical protein